LTAASFDTANSSVVRTAHIQPPRIQSNRVSL
jgi:hypothetical protein